MEFHGSRFEMMTQKINKLAACSGIGDVALDDFDNRLHDGPDRWSFGSAVAQVTAATWSSEDSTEDAVAASVPSFSCVDAVWSFTGRATSHISRQTSLDFWSFLRSRFQSSCDEGWSIFLRELASAESGLDDWAGIFWSLCDLGEYDISGFVWIFGCGSGGGLSLLLQRWFGGLRCAENGDGDKRCCDFGN